MNEPSIRPDICAHLLKVCEHCQHEFLDELGITCLFDVDSGPFPAWQCNAIGQIVEAQIYEICTDRTAIYPHGRITVALHHRDDTWILAIRDQGIRKPDRNMPARSEQDLNIIALPLQGTCHTRIMPDGMFTAVAFVADARSDASELDIVHVPVLEWGRGRAALASYVDNQ